MDDRPPLYVCMWKEDSYGQRSRMACALVLVTSALVVAGGILAFTFSYNKTGDTGASVAISLKLQEMAQALPDRFRKEWESLPAQRSLQNGFSLFVQSRLKAQTPSRAHSVAAP